MESGPHISRLERSHLKSTPRRRAVIDLLAQKKRYFSPLEIWILLKVRFRNFGLQTAYRILEELTQVGILTRLDRGDRQLYYFLCDTPHTIHHHHFICRQCKGVQAVEFCNFDAITQFLEENLDCVAEEHVLQIEGLCSNCREERP
jgi:Fe2+ or Zn2+ uptake regulation protein